MEITTKLLETIYNRVEQIYLAKTNSTPDSIELTSNGDFYCNESWSTSYGGIDYRSEIVTAEDLTTDLDELIKIRKDKEEVERQEQEKRQKENNERYKQEEKIKRFAEFEKLKKEFGC
jgi:hypothetical protein